MTKPAPAKPVATGSMRDRIVAAQRRLGAPSPDLVVDAALALLERLGHVPVAGEHVVLVALDGTKPGHLFANSANVELHGWHGTEADLIRQVSAKSRLSEGAIAREGVLYYAKRVLANATRASRVQDEAGGQRRGVYGVNDTKFQEAHDRLKERREKITPTTIATEAQVNGGYRQAKKWMERRGIAESLAGAPATSSP